MSVIGSCWTTAVPVSSGWVSRLAPSDWIHAVAVLVTSCGVLWAVIQHVRSQKLSARLAVLEHRRRLYDHLRDVLLELNSSGNNFQPVWVHAHSLWIDSEHLVHSAVRDYLKSIADRIADLEALRNEIAATPNQATGDPLVNRYQEILRWLGTQHEARADVFEEYLRLP